MDSLPGAVKSEASELAVPAVGTIPTRDGEKDEHRADYLPLWQMLPVFIAMGLGIFILGLDNTIVGTATPSISNDFHSLQDIGWYGSAYRLTACPAQFFYSNLYDQFRVKWVLVMAVGILEIGSIVSATAPSSAAFIAGRAIAAFGSSGILVGVLVAISQSVPLRWRALCNSSVGGLECLGMIVAPVLGGVLTTNLTWRWCFWLNLPIGGFTIFVLVLFFKNSDKQKVPEGSFITKVKRLNFLNLLIFTGSVICFLLALQWGGTKYRWDSSRVISLLIISVVAFGVFIALEVLRKRRPTIPRNVILNRTVALCLVFAFCTSAAYNVIDFYLPIWFQAVKGASAAKSGEMLLPSVIGISISAIGSGFLVSAIGYYTPFMLLGSILMATGYGFLTAFSPSTENAAWIGWQVMFSIGFGLAVSQPWTAPQTVLSQKDIPSAIAAVAFSINFSATLFISISQNIFTNLLQQGLADVHGIDVDKIINQGATKLLETVPGSEREQVIHVYNFAITRTFWGCVVVSCLAMISALGMEWNSVKGSNNAERSEMEMI